MEHCDIADYALISDCHSAALINRAGSIDWLCFPDFDSPSVFGRLLDIDAGHWSITPRDVQGYTRRYVGSTMALVGRFETPRGVATLTEAMALGVGERGHEIGQDAPRALLRVVKCHEGEVVFDLEFAPRMEYGLVAPLLLATDGGLEGRAGSTRIGLSSPVGLEPGGGGLRAAFTLKAGDQLCFALHYAPTTEQPPSLWSQQEITARLADTIEAWESWSRLHQNYEGPWRDLVSHSGRVLQALTYRPTGAIVAAPTTSLPESVGGDRNWDYRFTWVRDASFTLQALWVAACPDEAHRFFDFLAQAALTTVRAGGDLQIMFGIRGEHDLTERTIPHLKGWRDSRPVRVGNGAWNQRQLDVYGELMGAVFQLKDHLTQLDPATLQFLVGVVDAAASRWMVKDQGIWEIRGEPRHFLYSKLMCWVALDRGIQLAEVLDAKDKIASWTKTRDEIRSVILDRGWSDSAESFVQSFDSDALDASSLMLSIVQFLPGNDTRIVATIEAVKKHLTDAHGLVFRYVSDDGLAGKEGSFLLCTFWLAQAQALAGQLEDARATFSRAIGFANDVGLLAEEALPDSRAQLGNFPQAFSHIGLINAAYAISLAEQAVGDIEARVAPSQEAAPVARRR